MPPDQLDPVLIILNERIEKLETLVTILVRRQVGAYSTNDEKSLEDDILWDVDLRLANPELIPTRTK